jgi:hypothetical protein
MVRVGLESSIGVNKEKNSLKTKQNNNSVLFCGNQNALKTVTASSTNLQAHYLPSLKKLSFGRAEHREFGANIKENGQINFAVAAIKPSTIDLEIRK